MQVFRVEKYARIWSWTQIRAFFSDASEMPRRSLGDVLAPKLQDNVDDDRGSEQWGDGIQRDDTTLSRYDTEEVAKEGGDGTH